MQLVCNVWRTPSKAKHGDTLTCVLSQFYDWLIYRNVSVIDIWDCHHHFLLVKGVWCHLLLVAKTQYCAVLVSRGWCKVTVSLLPPLQTLPYHGQSNGVRVRQVTGRERPLIVLCYATVYRTCSDTCNIGFPDTTEADTIWYDTPSIGSGTILIW